jgi:hypothetical protein
MDGLYYISDFFEAIETDARISITHIGIYAALLQYRIQNDFTNPIQVFSHEIMSIAKLSSAITYHKCVKQLSEYGYIRYEPSFNRTKGSKIYFSEKVKIH